MAVSRTLAQKPTVTSPSESGLTLHARSYDVTFAVVVPDRDMLFDVSQVLVPWATLDSGSTPTLEFEIRRNRAETGQPYTVLQNSEPVFEHPDRSVVLNGLEAAIQHAVACESSGYTFVHAGVVAIAGCGVVIPGPSLSGKSTLICALVNAGAVYYSDEFAVLDPGGRIYPFRRQPHLRTDVADASPGVSWRGLSGELTPLSQTVILACEYVPGSHWQSKRVTPGDGLLKMMANTVSARTRPIAAMRSLANLASMACSVVAFRGEARDAVPGVIALVEAACKTCVH